MFTVINRIPSLKLCNAMLCFLLAAVVILHQAVSTLP